MIIRTYADKDKASLLRLLQHGHDATFTQERFEWQHEKSPGSPSEIVVAVHRDEVIGCYAAIKKTVLIGTESFIGGRDIDPVVDPRFRRRGVFTALLEFSVEFMKSMSDNYHQEEVSIHVKL